MDCSPMIQKKPKANFHSEKILCILMAHRAQEWTKYINLHRFPQEQELFV